MLIGQLAMVAAETTTHEVRTLLLRSLYGEE